MHILIALSVTLAAWRWADWARFETFHPTILYIVSMDLLYYFFTYDYQLWIFRSNLGVPEEVVDLLHTFIVLPGATMIFLSKFPAERISAIFYTAKWVFVFFSIEWVFHLFNLIQYDNGWSLVWSAIFLIVMFPMLILHCKRPLIAYGLSVVVIALLLIIFNVPWLY
ncbi:hypothetical protein SAMN05216238_101401 [Lentibacillus persicus]|uniref:Uncharacterized protein n=1 Tax=Lentibacillus persicus TaxID=640948 RepID=A0A1I1SFT1_9BACI|nr:CBO0543 family protein [Lentibacillus persicus]SFD45182.1 hypothetical protein SAMN05216238_101401 [Lentibacillus persicus]